MGIEIECVDTTRSVSFDRQDNGTYLIEVGVWDIKTGKPDYYSASLTLDELSTLSRAINHELLNAAARAATISWNISRLEKETRERGNETL